MKSTPDRFRLQRHSPSPDELREGNRLVAGIRQGEVAAFEELYRLFWNVMYSFAFRYVQSAEEAEDVVQEVFFRIWRNRTEWNVVGSVQSYLFISVRNEAIGRLRRHATQQRWRQRTNTDELLQDASDQDESLQSAETSADIERSLAEMPARRRAVCALRWIDGLSYAQIAERLSITEKTVENQIGIGLKFMRERITAR